MMSKRTVTFTVETQQRIEFDVFENATAYAAFTEEVEFMRNRLQEIINEYCDVDPIVTGGRYSFRVDITPDQLEHQVEEPE
jgi:hypothetical protein